MGDCFLSSFSISFSLDATGLMPQESNSTRLIPPKILFRFFSLLMNKVEIPSQARVIILNSPLFWLKPFSPLPYFSSFRQGPNNMLEFFFG